MYKYTNDRLSAQKMEAARYQQGWVFIQCCVHCKAHSCFIDLRKVAGARKYAIRYFLSYRAVLLFVKSLRVEGYVTWHRLFTCVSSFCRKFVSEKSCFTEVVWRDIDTAVSLPLSNLFVVFEREIYQVSKCKSDILHVQILQTTKAASFVCVCAHRALRISFSRNSAYRKSSMYLPACT